MSTSNRRKFIKVSGALAAALLSTGILTNTAFAADTSTAKVMTTGLAVTDTTVKVGILHSATGTMAISETGSIQAEKLAIEQNEYIKKQDKIIINLQNKLKKK